jgi:transposase
MGAKPYSKAVSCETLIKGKTPDERYRIRQEKSLPVLAEFKTWLIKSKEQVISQDDLSTAI